MATAETTNLPAAAPPSPPPVQEAASPEYVAELEKRLLTLERRFHGMEARMDALSKSIRNDEKPWWEQISGCMADNPAFDEMVRLGREFRESDRPKD